MNRDLKQEKAESKKPYEPPRLATISLRPEEAVLGHCKTTTTGGPNPGGCAFLCGPTFGS